MVLVLYPTVAFSDLVFTLATLYSFALNFGHNMFATIAFLSMIVASSLGVLRYFAVCCVHLIISFGVSTDFFDQHALATEISKFVGFPMLSLAVAFGQFDRRNKPFSYIVDVVILLAGWYICEKKYSFPIYEKILTTLAVAILIYGGT
jgi:hypothetical protein